MQGCDDTVISQHLSQYLKSFKASFHAQVSIIESLSTDCLDYEEKISKAKQSLAWLGLQISQHQVATSRVKNKMLERFCLRINEYIQFRISKAKAAVQQDIINQLQGMCLALYRVFSQMTRDKQHEGETLAGIFIRISEIQNKHMLRIFKKLLQNLSASKLLTGAPHLLSEFLDAKIRGRFHHLDSGVAEALSQSTTSHSRKDSLLGDVQGARVSQARRSLADRVDNSLSANFFNPYSCRDQTSAGRLPSSSSFSLDFKNPEEHLQRNYNCASGLENSQTSQKNLSLAIYQRFNDIVELGPMPTPRYTEQSLFKQLLENNKKNLEIIQRFRRKALRRRERPRLQQALLQEELSSVRHRRSNTLDGHTKRPFKQDLKMVGLPSIGPPRPKK